MLEETSPPSDYELATSTRRGKHDAVIESGDSSDDAPPAERWAPLGATSPSPPPQPLHEINPALAMDQLKKLEEEQEQLNSSLLALTTHFAQMQFRLRQISSSPSEDKERLLQELEDFAFKGIPDVRGCKIQHAQMIESMSEQEHAEKLNEQREKQQELIGQLKSQLDELEKYAYESGSADHIPTSVALENQRIVIDELRTKLKLDLANIDELSSEQLRNAVDDAVGQIVNPVKVKEMVVEQLKTQVTDLERFIEFLQEESASKIDATTPLLASTDGGPATINSSNNNSSGGGFSTTTTAAASSSSSHGSSLNHNYKDKINETTYNLLRTISTALQLFIVSNLGCGGSGSNNNFHKNLLKRTMKANHWGDLRARLEVSIEKVLNLARHQEDYSDHDDAAAYTSDSDESEIAFCNQELISAVRKEFTIALRDLIQHGLIEMSQNSSIVRFGCLPDRRGQSRDTIQMMHAWDLMLKYYDLKRGKEYNESPARKLSEAFDLSMVGGRAVTSKQTLLSTIGMVVRMHTPLRRSSDSHFKAFVCMGLNQRKLVPWLRLVLRNASLVEYYYQPWSYVVKTGFEDAFRSLDRLSSVQVRFTLPTDLAVRQFHNIRDAF